MKAPKDYIIFPLDVPTADEAKRYVEMLAGHVGLFKVGLELFIHAGPQIVDFIHAAGADVFMDLKLHDIPVTVRRAMAAVAALGCSLATVHCGESAGMLEAAVAGGAGKVGVVAVTVLTSVRARDLRDAGVWPSDCADMEALVLRRARRARAAGCIGVVCSGLEVAGIKQALGADFMAVTPGIRPRWAAQRDDQQRVCTPAQAVAAGADYVVVGRPIRQASDPRQAARRIAGEIAAVL